jgi:hypothetical protein
VWSFKPQGGAPVPIEYEGEWVWRNKNLLHPQEFEPRTVHAWSPSCNSTLKKMWLSKIYKPRGFWFSTEHARSHPEGCQFISVRRPAVLSRTALITPRHKRGQYLNYVTTSLFHFLALSSVTNHSARRRCVLRRYPRS